MTKTGAEKKKLKWGERKVKWKLKESDRVWHLLFKSDSEIETEVQGEIQYSCISY